MTKTDFRAVVLAAQKNKKMTVYRLSKISGVAWTTLNDWLSGQTNIGDDKLAKICDALDVRTKGPAD